MADLVGSAICIPGTEWNPPEPVDSVGYISKHYPPTARFPAGRIEVTITPDAAANRKKVERYYWTLEDFKSEWITSGPSATEQAPSGRATATTPAAGRTAAAGRSRGRSRAAATDSVDATDSGAAAATTAGLTSPGRSPSRGRTRRTRGASGSSGEGTEALRSPSPQGRGGRLRSRAAAVTTTRRGVASAAAAAAAAEEEQDGEQRPELQDLMVVGTAMRTHQGGAPPAPIAAKAEEGEEEEEGQRHYQPRRQQELREGSAAWGGSTAAPPQPPGRVHLIPHLTPGQNALNALLMVAVGLPALAYGVAVAYGWMPEGAPRADSAAARALADGDPQPLDLAWWLAVGRYNPFLAVNLVFFANVDVGFWLVSLITGSTWLIDPYWTIIPVMIGSFYQFHPLAVSDPMRSRASIALLWLWSVRLTHSYFRREEWQFGAREDWRFTDMSAQLGRIWWLVSFFATYLSQHVMLVGITWPLLTVHTSPTPWHPVWDTLIIAAAVAGITCAATADTQLQAFKVRNERLKAAGLPPILILDTGIWSLSRHPNYFGEMLWWWAIGFFGIFLGEPWTATGTFLNSAALAAVTVMVEGKMRAKPERLEAWNRYCQRTSVWLPWWPKAAKQHQD